MVSKFNNIEIAELENIGCKCTPYCGYKDDLFFSIDNKKGIILDYYKEKDGKIVDIITVEDITFEELKDKLT